MPTAENVMDQARKLLEARLKELDQERLRLERAIADLTGGRIGRRGPGRPRGSTNQSKSKTTRRRRSGTRAEQAADLVKKNPGISAGEVAKKLGIKPNYVYRVMSELEKEGRVKKDGRRYQPA